MSETKEGIAPKIREELERLRNNEISSISLTVTGGTITAGTWTTADGKTHEITIKNS